MFRSVRAGTIAGLLTVSMIISAIISVAIADEDSATKLAAATKGAETVAQMASEPAMKPEPAAVIKMAAKTKTGGAPINGRLIHQATGEQVCIGGVLCPDFCTSKNQNCAASRSLTIKLDNPAKITTIQLSAHDNIGKTRRSRLVFKINGKQVADSLVYRLGSTLSIDVGETGELITIESAHQHNGFLRGGEEAVIWDVYVFGDVQG
ncbi:MAG: hypothetical protein ACTSSQ_04300 [Alphaproteobacteria bacterium]